MQGNSSSKKRRKAGTGSESLEILEKDFTLYEVFNLNNIEELNPGREKTLGHHEVLTNLKGWKIEKRMRIENNGTGRVDKIYRHPRSKKALRSRKQVKKFIEENSCIKRASDNGEGTSQDPNVNLSSSSDELFQQHPYVNVSSLGGNQFQDANVNFPSPAAELFHDPYFKLSSLGSEFYQDPNLNFYSSDGGEMFQHSNVDNVDIFSSGGDVLQDQSPCMNPESRFHLHVYASMLEGYTQQPQVLGSSRGYNPGTDRSRLAGMASSSSIHLQPQSQEPSTQRQNGDMLQAQNRALVVQVRALEEQNRVMKAQVHSFQTIVRSSGITISPTLGSGGTNEKGR